MEKLKRLVIAGKTYPYKIDLNVLEHIQNEYGSIHQFERELIGLEFMKDKNGNIVYKDGLPIAYKKEPSIKAIKTVLPEAIREGLQIEADEHNTSVEEITDDYIIRECTIPFDVLGKILHEEFTRCFETKK